MAKQRLVIDSADQEPFFLSVEGGFVTVGRSREQAAVLGSLRVARIRCELEGEGEALTVRCDEPGRPGTVQPVRPGESLRVAGAQLRLETTAEPSSPAEAPPEPAAAPELELRLHVIDGGDMGQFFKLPASGTVTLGKDRRHAEITLHDLYVGRVHCELVIAEGKVTVVDNSSHGTLINGQKIKRQEMNVGDVLRIGNSHLRLEVAVAGPEFAKVSGKASEEEEQIEVVVEESPAAAAEDFEVVEDEDEAGAPQASAALVLLRQWREKLPSLSGQAFGHYKLGTPLGRGRCGIVFQAEDAKSGQTLALKVLSPQFPHNDQELQRFTRGVKALLPLRHPNLVTLLGAGKSGAYTWLAREYVEGESVAEVLERIAEGKHGSGSVRRACRVALHVGRALDFAHAHRCRHGKVMPANLFIERETKCVKVADLMLGAMLEKSQLWSALQEQRPLTELPYLSPEQTDPNGFVDQLSDLYGLGAVVYALLTGRPPFVGDTAAEILEQVGGPTRAAKPSAFNDDVPTALDKVVLKLIAKRQEDRFQTPAELVEQITPIAEEAGVEV